MNSSPLCNMVVLNMNSSPPSVMSFRIHNKGCEKVSTTLPFFPGLGPAIAEFCSLQVINADKKTHIYLKQAELTISSNKKGRRNKI